VYIAPKREGVFTCIIDLTVLPKKKMKYRTALV